MSLLNPFWRKRGLGIFSFTGYRFLEEKHNPVLPRPKIDHERLFIMEIGFKIQYFLKFKLCTIQTLAKLMIILLFPYF